MPRHNEPMPDAAPTTPGLYAALTRLREAEERIRAAQPVPPPINPAWVDAPITNIAAGIQERITMERPRNEVIDPQYIYNPDTDRFETIRTPSPLISAIEREVSNHRREREIMNKIVLGHKEFAEAQSNTTHFTKVESIKLDEHGNEQKHGMLIYCGVPVVEGARETGVWVE